MDSAPPGRTRQFWYGLAFIVAIGLVGIVIGAFALAGVACGCTRPADIVVVNHSSTDAVIEWQRPGLLGTPLFRSGGREQAAACQTTGLAMDEGDLTVVVSAGGRAQPVAVTVSDSRSPSAWIAIDSAGQVTAGTGATDATGTAADLCR